MIKKFKNQETKESGIIYKANLDSVKELYLNGEKELAFETAVACMELACGGKISSENYLVKAITANLKEVADRTNQKYEEKKQRTAQERITKLQLNEIAEMLNNGVNQQTIADTLNQSKQTISYRINILKKDYGYLLNKSKSQKSQTNQIYDNVNDIDNDNVNVIDNGNATDEIAALNTETNELFKQLLF